MTRIGDLEMEAAAELGAVIRRAQSVREAIRVGGMLRLDEACVYVSSAAANADAAVSRLRWYLVDVARGLTRDGRRVEGEPMEDKELGALTAALCAAGVSSVIARAVAVSLLRRFDLVPRACADATSVEPPGVDGETKLDDMGDPHPPPH